MGRPKRRVATPEPSSPPSSCSGSALGSESDKPSLSRSRPKKKPRVIQPKSASEEDDDSSGETEEEKSQSRTKKRTHPKQGSEEDEDSSAEIEDNKSQSRTKKKATALQPKKVSEEDDDSSPETETEEEVTLPTRSQPKKKPPAPRSKKSASKKVSDENDSSVETEDSPSEEEEETVAKTVNTKRPRARARREKFIVSDPSLLDAIQESSKQDWMAPAYLIVHQMTSRAHERASKKKQPVPSPKDVDNSSDADDCPNESDEDSLTGPRKGNPVTKPKCQMERPDPAIREDQMKRPDPAIREDQMKRPDPAISEDQMKRPEQNDQTKQPEQNDQTKQPEQNDETNRPALSECFNTDHADREWLQEIAPKLDEETKLGLLATAFRTWIFLTTTTPTEGGGERRLICGPNSSVKYCSCSRCGIHSNNIPDELAPHLKDLLDLLGWPPTLGGFMWCRALYQTVLRYEVDDVMQELLVSAAKSTKARHLQGHHHVLSRLAVRRKHYNGCGIIPHILRQLADLDTHGLLFHQVTKEDVEDLIGLGWKPTIIPVINLLMVPHLGKRAANSICEFVLPRLWKEAIATFPFTVSNNQVRPASQSILMTPVDAAPLFEPHLLSDPLREKERFWTGPVSERWTNTYSATSSLGASNVKFDVGRDRPDREVRGLRLQKPNLQRLLCILHKLPVLMQWTFARHRINWTQLVGAFDGDDIGAALQLLLRPPATSAPCRCLFFSLDINATIRVRIENERRVALARNEVFREQPGAFSPPSHAHKCVEGHALQTKTGLSSPLCSVWFRPDTGGMRDADVEWTSLLLKKRLSGKYALPKIGRAVAAAHVLAILFWRRVPTTTILVLGDVVIEWANRPSERALRTILTAISQLPLPSPGPPSDSESPAVETPLLLSQKPRTSRFAAHLRAMHAKLCRYGEGDNQSAFPKEHLTALANVYSLIIPLMSVKK